LKKEKTDMAKKTIETNAEPRVHVQRVGSDLQVKGWDRPEVLVKSSSDNNLTLEEQDAVITVSSPSDCFLYVPHNASIEVSSTGTNARFRSVFGGITISKIGSDLFVRDIGPLSAENVGTDFSAKRINGELSIKKVGSSATLGDVATVTLGTVGSQLVAKRVRGDLKIEERVGGNAVIQDVDGQVEANSIGGSLHLREVSGGITADVGGNATVEISPVSWQSYGVDSGGSLRCHIPGDANATFEILSGARDIGIKTPEISEKITAGNYTLTLGEGAASVKLTAGGSVNITTRGRDWEGVQDFEIDFGEEIGSLAEEITEQATRQIESQLEMLESNLNVHLSGLATSISTAGLSEERAREVQERLEAAKVRAAQRAEAAGERAKARLKLKVAAAQRKTDRKVRAAAARAARKDRKSRGERSFTITTPPPTKPVDPVSEEERMMILQMLQDKKISVEQAEKLLTALEGKGS
jgi:hypothetical protein